MRSIVLIVASFGLVLWGCGEQDIPDGPRTFEGPAPKPVIVINPFKGLDEAGYSEGIGDPENVEKFLKTISGRLAMLMRNKDLRTQLMDHMRAAEGKPVNLSDLLLSSQKISDKLSADFKRAVAEKGVTGRLGTEIITRDTDADALLQVSEALFGL